MHAASDFDRWVLPGEEVHARVLDARWRAVEPHCRGARCLELGAADAELTAHLLPRFGRVMSVEPSALGCRSLLHRHADSPNLHVVCAPLDDLELKERFDTVVCGGEQLAATLRRAGEWLAEDGVLIAVVPNALSLDRMLEPERARGAAHDPDSLHASVEAAGWRLLAEGGTLVTPFSADRLEGMVDADLLGDPELDALEALARTLPRHARDVYAVAELA
jgi:hypothetical protein